MNILIRKAVVSDYKSIAEYLFYAMEDIVYDFIGQKNKAVAIGFLENFTKEQKNQYSYENCWVAVYQEKVVGAINVYDGSDLKCLREPIENYIKQNFREDFTVEDETKEGEMYIDTLGVSPDFRGKGIGTKLLLFLIQKICYEDQKKLGLLVDLDNLKAEKLYLKLGFQGVSVLKISGKLLKHLQKTNC